MSADCAPIPGPAEWDAAYRAGGHNSQWPWSDLISLVHRHARPANGFRRVLELGCGSGANIPFFLSLGVDYSAIEGSPFIVDSLRARFPQIADKIAVGDFTVNIPFDGPFDLIVDRSSVTCNTTAAIEVALSMTAENLRSGGKLLGIDWFSTTHSAALSGTAVDAHTRTDLPGTLTNIGRVHFSDREHLLSLLTGAGFKIEMLNRKSVLTETDFGINAATAHHAAWWAFVAVKP